MKTAFDYGYDAHQRGIFAPCHDKGFLDNHVNNDAKVGDKIVNKAMRDWHSGNFKARTEAADQILNLKKVAVLGSTYTLEKNYDRS